MKITVACIAFGIGVCFRCVHVPSVAHAMFAAVLVIAMTPCVGLKRGLLIYEGSRLTQVQNQPISKAQTICTGPFELRNGRSRRTLKVNLIGARLCSASWRNFSFPGVTDKPIVFSK